MNDKTGTKKRMSVSEKSYHLTQEVYLDHPPKAHGKTRENGNDDKLKNSYRKKIPMPGSDMLDQKKNGEKKIWQQKERPY